MISTVHSDTDGRLNEGCQYRDRIDAKAAGQTVLDYLSRRYRHSTEAEWRENIAAGRVLIDTRPTRPERVLQRGHELVWQRPPWIEPAAPRWTTVLYEDEDLLAVAKPAGLPTLPGANFFQTTLLHQVRSYAADAAPLHRLGRWTSGVVLCARNHAARMNLMQQWAAAAVGKRYRALASGDPAWTTLTVTAPIGPLPHALLGTLHGATSHGKRSLSRVTVLERRADAFVCDVHIETGRPHQIRIHLAAAGHPLAGDPLYVSGGIAPADTTALPGDPGYHLHSAELTFHHPVTGHALTIACEPPPLLQLATEQRPSL